MAQIICQVLINYPKRQLIIGVLLFVLGLGWFAGGPIRVALAQDTPESCAQGAIQGPDFKPTDPANTSTIAQPNEKALNFRLKCDFDPNDPKAGVVGVWRILLGAADIVIALYLVAIAIATIFHIQYDTYSIKKTLPPLIVGVILANFSLFIVRFLVDFATVLTATFINAEGGKSEFLTGLINGLFVGSAQAIGGAISDITGGQSAIAQVTKVVGFLVTGGGTIIWAAMTILGLIGIIIPALMILVLALLFYARYYVILLLAVLSPLAFVSMAFPPTQFLFKRWWGELIRWVFMLPVSFFLLWLAIQFTNIGANEANFASYFITLVFMYLAIRVPFSWGTLMGAGVTGKVYDYAKKAGVLGTVAGAGALAYGIGYLRRKGGAAGIEATKKRGAAAGLKQQLRGKFPGYFEARAEWEEARRPWLAKWEQAKQAKDAHGFKEAQEELKKIEEKYRPIMQEVLKEEKKGLGLMGKRKNYPEKLRRRDQELQLEREARKAGKILEAEVHRLNAKKLSSEIKGWEVLDPLLTERAKLTGEAKTFEAKKGRLEGYADKLAYLHLPGIIEAVKTRFKTGGEFGEKELKKTKFYRNLAGPFFQQDAGYAAYESIRHFTPEQAAQFLNQQLLQKIDQNLYKTPERLAELLRDIVSEAPARMLQYLRDNLKEGQKMSDFEFGAAQRGAELGLRYLSGRPDLRNEFSNSLQRTSSVGSDPEVIAEYIRSGGAAGISPVPPRQRDRVLAETIGQVIAQQLEPVDEELFSNELINLTVGRVNVREEISANTLRTTHQGLIVPARGELQTVLSMKSPTDVPRRLNQVVEIIDRHVENLGVNAHFDNLPDAEKVRLNAELGDGARSTKKYFNATKTRQKIAELLALKIHPQLSSDRAEIQRRARNYVEHIRAHPPGGRR